MSLRSSFPCPFLPSQAPLRCALQVPKAPVEWQYRGTSLYQYNFSTCPFHVTPLERQTTEKLSLNAPIGKHDDDILPRSLGNIPSILRAQPCQCSRESTTAAPTNQHALVAHEQFYGGERTSIIRLYPRVDHIGLSCEHVRSEVIADTLNDVRTTFICLVQRSRESENGTNLGRVGK